MTEQNEQLNNELKQLKQELFTLKEAVPHLRELVNQELLRDYPTDLWELSDKELDHEMGNRLGFMNDDIDTIPKMRVLPRSLNPVSMLKRFIRKHLRHYTDFLLEKQKLFNDKLVAFHLASFIRMRRTEERLTAVETKLKELTEDMELMGSSASESKEEHHG